MTQKGQEGEQLQRWRANVANGSQLYADISFRRLLAFAKDVKSTPTTIGEMEVADLRRSIEDYLAREKKRGHTGGYIATTLKAVRSWRIYCGKPVVEGLKVPNTTLSPRTDRESMPTQEDLRRVFLAATPHERVAIALMAFGGVRPQVLGSYDGTDGLMLGDLPELRIEKQTVSFDKTPAIVRVRAKNSKTKNAYFTFIGEEGCLAVKQYLEQRIIGGEKLGAMSDLVHPERANKRFVTTTKVGVAVRRAMRAAGLDQRPYVWRAYFLSRLLEASNAGKVSDRYAEFWAGHTGDVTAKHYTTGRAILPSSMIEDMRMAYKRCEPFLSTVPSSGHGGRDIGTLKLLLELLGVPEGKVSEADLMDATPEQLKEIARKYMGQATVARQRVVSNGEISKLLGEGWTFVAALEGSQAVLRPPEGP